MRPPISHLALLLTVSAVQPEAWAQDPSTLPLLGDDDVHLYVQEAYEGFAPDVTAAVAGRYGELVDAGMDTARHLFDWADLEPIPGIYDTALVVEAMDARIASGITHQFCNLVTVDSGGPVVPDFIADLLAAGVAWDDPRISGPFRDLLDVYVPLMLERDMVMVGFGNEPSGYFEDGEPAAPSYAPFVAQAIAHTRTLAPELACTVVFAGPTDAAIPSVMPLLDVASFNTYFYEPVLVPSCLWFGAPIPQFLSQGPEIVGQRLDELIAAAGGRLICIQEIGQATGWGDLPQTLGPLAGLETQRQCFEALQVELAARREHFRTVCLWTLNDHTIPGMQYLVDDLTNEGAPACLANNAAEIFGPTGIVRSDATASKKPAFDEFEQAVRFFADASYGCSAPSDSLEVLKDQPPKLGGRLEVALHNPLGTQTAAASVLFIAFAPASGFPCGLPLSGFGMAGGGSAGEALLDPATLVVTVNGPTWQGTPVTLGLDIPANPALIDLPLFLQGALIGAPGDDPLVAVTDGELVVIQD